MSEIASQLNGSRLLALTGAVFALLLAVALAMWAYYGNAVFFEMIRAGIAACF